MSRKWGRKCKKSGTLAGRASSPFHLKSFLSSIHSFWSFVCLTNHYNYTQFNGEECTLSKQLSSQATCVVHPTAHPQAVTMCCSVLLSPQRPGTLRTISPNFPPLHACCSFPVAYSDVSSWLPFLLAQQLSCPSCLGLSHSAPQTDIARGVSHPQPVFSPQTHHRILGRHISGSHWLSCPVF